ncbi:hypothetical protein EUGRSUZ_I00579 [Eucalyptus grandis]|uniref:Uncharacterized protein n=2 Tax=Eucalyptus grandis TaxID=71139 RepID=A0ACC3JD37_EUCGR|nr:hypothetical protein EUGRSUZ_I00579 [Eucalyptus grandis]
MKYSLHSINTKLLRLSTTLADSFKPASRSILASPPSFVEILGVANGIVVERHRLRPVDAHAVGDDPLEKMPPFPS